MRAEGGKKIHADYEQLINKAELAFCHQRIFNTLLNRTTCLLPLPDGTDENLEEWDFLGKMIPDNVAVMIAKGNICPITQEIFTFPPPPDRGAVAAPAGQVEKKTTDNRFSRKYHSQSQASHAELIVDPAGRSKFYTSNPYIKELGKPRSITASKKPIIPANQKTIKDFFVPKIPESV